MDIYLEITVAAGSAAKLAALLGISRQAVQQWETRGIPPRRAPELERLTGVPRQKIAPDMYR